MLLNGSDYYKISLNHSDGFTSLVYIRFFFSTYFLGGKFFFTLYYLLADDMAVPAREAVNGLDLSWAHGVHQDASRFLV